MPNFYPELNEYINILFHSPLGEEGRRYMKERNISPYTAKYWKLGYSPNSYTPKCYKELNQNNVTKFWKKLNGRIIIPIFNQNGKLISLSGRAIFKGMWPKYDHYPFPAKRTLFGLYQNKNNIRKENKAVITEGQIDVITAWQNNIRIITCSFGAHAGQEHFALLGRYTGHIYIVYDADPAGIRGTKNIKKLNKSDLDINLCFNLFPKGMDLDNWISTNTNPKDKFMDMLDNYQIYALKNKLKSDSSKELISENNMEIFNTIHQKLSAFLK